MPRRSRLSRRLFLAQPKKPTTAKGRPLQYETLEDRLALAVVISEFLAENDAGVRDTAGHRHDWIELTNTGAVAADISGWSLTDDALDMAKWQIPATPETTNLAPGASLLVFASGSGAEVGVIGGELHSNFQLSLEPGYLALVQDDGVTVASEFNLYPQQFRDVSYGQGVGVGSTVTETLLTAGTSAVGDGSPAKFRPFTGPNASVDDHWTEVGYVATAGDGWVNATDGLGFGYGSPWQDSTVSLAGQISGYVRMPFQVTNKAELAELNLELRVDNGYILFLNGREVQRERLQMDLKIGNDWELNSRQNVSNSTLTGSPTVIDLTEWLDTIEEGDNVLAIYAANHSSDSSDLLVHAELTAQRASGPLAETFMVTPTPGGGNGAGYLGVIADTVFSHDRGFYDAPFPLTITTAEPGTTIRYTTDGTRPTLANGLTYVDGSPIIVDPAALSHADAGVVTVRAAAFKAGYFSTNVDTQTYVFLDSVLTQDATGLPAYSPWGYAGPDWAMNPAIVSGVGAEKLKSDLQSIPTMSLVMDWEEFFGNGGSGDDDGIYTQDTSWRDKSDERFASLEYFNGFEGEDFQIDSVVEIQGHSSTSRWRSDKLSLQVKFKQPYDTRLNSDSLFAGTADGDNAANGFDTLVLDSQYNYSFTVNNTSTQGPYATYVHDQVVADMVNLAGGEAAHGRWVHLYINGLYWGIYNAHERPDDSFAEEYYGGDKDDYLVVKGFDGIGMTHGGAHDKYLQVDGGLTAEAAYVDLLDQVNGNLASLSAYQQVEQILDIDSFIDYMVVLYYAGNYDWGENNWFASLDSADPDGQWHFHEWDQEHAFPNDQNAPAGDGRNQDYDHTALVANDFGEHEFGPTGIHHKLMQSAEYRLRFSDRVEELLRNDGLLTPVNAQAVWQARVDEIAGAINAEAARWGDNRSPAKDGGTWATNVQYTTDNFFFANGPYQSRTDIILGIFNNTIAPGGSGQVGKTDWLVNLNAPVLSQYGGEIAASYLLTLANPNAGGTIYYTIDGSDPRTAGGGVSPSAVAYTSGAISLTEATRVRTRVLDAGQSGTADDWSAEVDKTFTLDEPLSLRVVEVMYNPAASGDLEYLELVNTGSQPIELGGVQLADFSTGGYTFVAQTLAPGERIVVPQDVSAFQAAYPAVTNVTATAFSGSLSNSGETVTLLDSFGVVLQSFTYSDLAPWPADADGAGRSLEYAGPFDADSADPMQTAGDPYDDASNWLASLTDGGSPGVGRSLPGDYDSNGLVERADYDVWRATYGSTTDLRADGNGDSVVNSADYAYWRDQYEAAQAAALPRAAATESEAHGSAFTLVAAPASAQPAIAVGTGQITAPASESALATPQPAAGFASFLIPPHNQHEATRPDRNSPHSAELGEHLTGIDELLMLLSIDQARRFWGHSDLANAPTTAWPGAADAAFSQIAEAEEPLGRAYRPRWR
ncbi:CotH protein [Posidoniimonas polymericola]|uniref:CotH protein n=1 Tax=Posidoniimonas polymericola TaxID=2528002 RepID=A0A5C5YU26_9BACT|nr:CotH kinase family protein [Posidoniimonas polymericola]TWT78310.1 CotH protein [Posidoniimonas polymericola]